MKSNEKILEEILFYLSGNRLSTMPNIYLRAALTAMDKVQPIPSPTRGFTVEEMEECFARGYFAAVGKEEEPIPRIKFQDYIASLPSTTVEGEQWVSAETPSSHGHEVLMYCEVDGVVTGWYNEKIKEWWNNESHGYAYKVTHYMEKPAPPKQ